jgi:chromosome segregation ATPase
MQELIRAVNESENLYGKFPGTMMEIEQKIKQLNTNQFQVKVVERAVKEEGKEANVEVIKLKAILNQKERELSYLKEKLKSLNSSKEHYEKRVYELEETLNKEKEQARTIIETTKSNIEATMLLKLNKQNEEISKLKEQVIKSEAILSKAQELDKMYQEEIKLLKDELAKALNEFGSLERELLSTGSIHNVRLKFIVANDRKSNVVNE